MITLALLLLLAEAVSWKELAYLIAMVVFFFMQQKANSKAAEAAGKAAEVKVALATATEEHNEKLSEIKTTVTNSEATQANIYKLSNHAYGAALRSTALALRTVAELRPESESAQKAATEAERLADEHDVRQKEVDHDIAMRTLKIDEATSIVDKAKESPPPHFPNFDTEKRTGHPAPTDVPKP